MEEQQGQMGQVPGNIPDERIEENTGQDEFTRANRDVYQGGQIRNVPEAKESEIRSTQTNQDAASGDPRGQRGAIHQAADGNQLGGQ